MHLFPGHPMYCHDLRRWPHRKRNRNALSRSRRSRGHAAPQRSIDQQMPQLDCSAHSVDRCRYHPHRTRRMHLESAIQCHLYIPLSRLYAPLVLVVPGFSGILFCRMEQEAPQNDTSSCGYSIAPNCARGRHPSSDPRSESQFWRPIFSQLLYKTPHRVRSVPSDVQCCVEALPQAILLSGPTSNMLFKLLLTLASVVVVANAAAVSASTSTTATVGTFTATRVEQSLGPKPPFFALETTEIVWTATLTSDTAQRGGVMLVAC
ncbi:hypothetical protein A0H81_06218 [Grifola frondosa]|uniref:Uncharacterized protein n=1 Tax=Grifola frondosa TaxID=5627 RepID=A0A1C7M9Z9_GRIFR|nr:hypothetical protein A0H81_06218 [Grifola frondosa]